jgi:hypothetical protein
MNAKDSLAFSVNQSVGKAPSAKLQAPNIKVRAQSNFLGKRAPNQSCRYQVVENSGWSLKFGASLELGAWNLELAGHVPIKPAGGIKITRTRNRNEPWTEVG